jgi:hypothetical protein
MFKNKTDSFNTKPPVSKIEKIEDWNSELSSIAQDVSYFRKSPLRKNPYFVAEALRRDKDGQLEKLLVGFNGNDEKTTLWPLFQAMNITSTDRPTPEDHPYFYLPPDKLVKILKTFKKPEESDSIKTQEN